MALKPGQITCINTLDQPLVVAAGAGSGKTFTLTKRIVHALESGFVRDIDQVLAITFTKKAAGELKSRIKSSLAAAGMMDQALKVDEAWISTIHGMCARILRAHAVELDIDPKFKVGAAAVLGEYLSDAINQALIEAELNDPEQLDALFKAYPAQAQKRGASVEGMVRELVDRMSAAYEGAQAVRMCEEAVDATRCLAHVVDCADQLRALVEAQKESSRQASALSSLNDAVEDMRKALACAPVEPQRALALMGEVPASYGFGNAEFKSASKELVALMQHDAVRVRLLLSHEHLGAIVSLAQRSLELFSARK